MSTVNRSIVAAVFQDESQAQQAMADLQNAGFTDDQIRYSVHKGGAGILDALMGLGFAQDQANYYNSEFMSGRTVVTVNAGDRQQEAYDILMRNGAYDWNSRTGQTASSGSSMQTGQTDYGSNYTQTPTTEGEQNVRLREEQLQAQKQQVQAGEVGIHKDVVTEEKTLNVPVNREEVYIERKPVSGTVPADTPIGEEETYRVPVSEEQVQVTKQPVVSEEIGIGKRTVQDTQQVSDTVKREEARLNQRGDVNIEGAPVDDTTDR
jgi:uncharacterized protein (TIGR02271 family)